ncbi:alpha/beta fold hydrolase [Falsigemmobacter faecalis]|nr:alpha/beta hydrolase [Falsigemmobacter faecalis]
MPRPRLILIPGTLNDEGLWRDQLAPLSLVADVSVADITKGESLEALARQVLALHSGPFLVAGFSLGGLVAQEVFRRAPDRVLGLGLLDTTMLPDTPAGQAKRDAMIKAASSGARFIGMGERLLAGYLAPQNLARGDIGARIQEMTLRLGAEVFIRQSRLDRPDNRDLLKTVTCPTLILCGEEDRITPMALHEEMARLIPHARFLRVKDAGHMTPMEQPEGVTSALVALVAEVTRQDAV